MEKQSEGLEVVFGGGEGGEEEEREGEEEAEECDGEEVEGCFWGGSTTMVGEELFGFLLPTTHLFRS